MTLKWHQSNIKSASLNQTSKCHQNEDIKVQSKWHQIMTSKLRQTYEPTSNESLGLTKKPEIFPVIFLKHQNNIKITSIESIFLNQNYIK